MRVAALQIAARKRASGAQAQQVVRILGTVDELGEHEELFRAAERYQLAARTHGAHVERGDVPRQRREGAVRPEKRLRAIGHMLVAERSRAHRLHDRAPRLAFKNVVHA